MAQITRKTAGDCADRSCPAVWETDDPEQTGITIRLAGPGDTTAGPDVPGEITGFVPTALLRAWASGQ
jgi:hypothetical protein